MNHSTRLAVQALEAREVPATITFLNGVFHITGTDKPDVVTVRRIEANIDILVRSGSDPIQTATKPASAVLQIIFHGGANTDTFTNLGTARSIVYGEGGNDIIKGGAGSDLLLGGEGNDYIRGNGGNDYLDGGLGIDNLDGGAHNDWLLTDKFDTQATSGRKVLLSAVPNIVMVTNGLKYANLLAVTKNAELDPTSTLFPVVDETRTLTASELSALQFPLFVGR